MCEWFGSDRRLAARKFKGFKDSSMQMSPYLIPGAATMAILAMVYLLFVFWTRRPGRAADLKNREAHLDETHDV